MSWFGPGHRPAADADLQDGRGDAVGGLADLVVALDEVRGRHDPLACRVHRVERTHKVEIHARLHTQVYGSRPSGDDGRSGGRGGAIENNGTLSLLHDRFAGNRAADPGGAIMNYATISVLAGDDFTGNRSAAYAGAIENDGTIGLATGDSFTGNTAESGPGAVDNLGTIT